MQAGRELDERIHLEKHGGDNKWHIFLDNEEIFSTSSDYEQAMFVAELKERLRLCEVGNK